MSDDAAVGDATGAPSYVVSFNVDQLTLGAGVRRPRQPAALPLPVPGRNGGGRRLAARPGAQPGTDAAQSELGSFGSYVAVADGDGNQLASAFVFVTAASGQAEGAAGVTLDAPVGPGGVPLFGGLRSVRTPSPALPAGQAFARVTWRLPSGAGGAAEPYAAVPSGFSLTVTVNVAGRRNFTLPTSSSPDSSSSASSSPPAVVARAAPAADASTPSVTWFPCSRPSGRCSWTRSASPRAMAARTGHRRVAHHRRGGHRPDRVHHRLQPERRGQRA